MKLCKTKSKICLLSLVLVFLPGCFWADKDSSSDSIASSSTTSLDSDTLMTIDGKVVLTVGEYEELLDAVCRSNQQIAMMIDAMPASEKDFVFKGIASSRLMKAWAEKSGVDQTKEFLQERKQAHEFIDLQLYMKYYDEAHPVHVGDKELKDFYEANKERIPALVVSSGGVDSQFVRFESKKEAEDFYDSVKDGSAEDFVSKAKNQYITVQEGLINKSSQYSPIIKKFAEKVKKTPYTELIKVSENSYWVIQALDKTEAEYRSLQSPEIKEGIRQMIIDQKKDKQMEENMNSLRKEMNAVENYDYFDQKAQSKEQEKEDQVLAQSAQVGMDYQMEQEFEKESKARSNISKM